MDLLERRRLGTIREIQNESILDQRHSDLSNCDERVDTYVSLRASELDENAEAAGAKAMFYSTL